MTEVAEITIRRCADTVDQYDDVNRVYTLGLADHAEVGDETWEKGRPDETKAIFEKVALSDEFPDFLTLPAYEYID